jgi:hypothetical protein
MYKKLFHKQMAKVRLNLRCIIGMQIYLIEYVSMRQKNAINELTGL